MLHAGLSMSTGLCVLKHKLVDFPRPIAPGSAVKQIVCGSHAAQPYISMHDVSFGRYGSNARRGGPILVPFWSSRSECEVVRTCIARKVCMHSESLQNVLDLEHMSHLTSNPANHESIAGGRGSVENSASTIVSVLRKAD